MPDPACSFVIAVSFHFCFLFITVELAPMFELTFTVAADNADFGGNGFGAGCGCDDAFRAIAP
jgi:hypothetical protein